MFCPEKILPPKVTCPQRVRRWLRVQANDIKSAARFVWNRLGSLFCVKIRAANKAKKNAKTSRAVLLVHGYFNDGYIWDVHKASLEKNGFLVYTIDLGNPFESIRSFAQKVHDRLDEIVKETGCRDITLIGYSMGGLVCCYYAAQFAPRFVSKIITIGAPLDGTPLAYLGLGQCAREMQPGSDLIQEMKEGLLNRPHIRLYNIASTADLIVPHSSAILTDDPTRQKILDDHGHNAMLFSRQVSAILLRWLQAAHS
jgi:triacylglycerol lipase